MPSVYDAENFSGRVNLLAKTIATGARTTRATDTCCEMNDGDEVCVAVYRRSLKNPAIARNIWRYLSQEVVMAAVERLAGVDNLAAEARKTRERSRAEFEAWMADLDAKRAAEAERCKAAAMADGAELLTGLGQFRAGKGRHVTDWCPDEGSAWVQYCRIAGVQAEG